MTDICKSLRSMPSSLNDACRTMEAAADEIELLRTQLDIAITALRRVVSLAEKNVPEYAQEIASEGLRYPVGNAVPALSEDTKRQIEDMARNIPPEDDDGVTVGQQRERS